MKTVSPAELHRLLTADPALAVLDVRTPVEFAAVHVAQAQNIPLDALRPGALPLPKDRPVYLLCQRGGRATKAAEQLAQAGFTNPIVVEGGTESWSNAGLPVEKSGASVISLERQVRIGAGSLVLLGVLLGWFVHPYFIGLSAFVGAGLVFAGLTDWCGMGLLLAKAPWNQRQSG